MACDIYKIIIVNRQKIVKIPVGLKLLVRRCCNAVIRSEKLDGSAEVSVMFVDNAYIQNLNEQYRKNNVPTDVLAFPRNENGEFDKNLESGAKVLGDIVISIEKALEQSKVYGHTLQREIAALTIHGMLHLFNYDHVKDELSKTIMFEREERIMELVGFKTNN